MFQYFSASDVRRIILHHFFKSKYSGFASLMGLQAAVMVKMYYVSW